MAKKVINNVMKKVKIEKLTLNFGAGTDQKKLEKGIKLLKLISGKEPIKTLSKVRIPTWGLRVGLPIGCMITLRGEEAEKLLVRMLKAKENKLKERCFDAQGNFSFGLHEYIDMQDVKYDAEIGIMGFECSVTLKKPGARISIKSTKRSKLPHSQRVSKEDAINFVKEKFKIEVI